MAIWEYSATLDGKAGASTSLMYVYADEAPTADAIERPRMPGPNEEWIDGEFRIPLTTLKQRALDRLNAKRDEHEFGAVQTPQGLLQIDERSQGRMQRTVELGRTFERVTGQPFATAWRMYDNSWAPVSLEVMDGWALLIGAQVQHVFSHYGELYALIAAAGTHSELEVIDIEGGWDVGAV